MNDDNVAIMKPVGNWPARPAMNFRWSFGHIDDATLAIGISRRWRDNRAHH
jgi:hypothetical protein